MCTACAPRGLDVYVHETSCARSSGGSPRRVRWCRTCSNNTKAKEAQGGAPFWNTAKPSRPKKSGLVTRPGTRGTRAAAGREFRGPARQTKRSGTKRMHVANTCPYLPIYTP